MTVDYDDGSTRTPACPNCDGLGFITTTDGDLLKCPTCNPATITPKSSHGTPRRRQTAPELPAGHVRRVKVEWLGTRIERTIEVQP